MLPKFTLRIPDELLEKLRHTATYNCRSQNKEIEVALRRYIIDFERLHGKIEVSSQIVKEA